MPTARRRRRRLAEDPSLPGPDGVRGRRRLRATPVHHVEHREQSDERVEAILAVRALTETVRDELDDPRGRRDRSGPEPVEDGPRDRQPARPGPLPEARPPRDADLVAGVPGIGLHERDARPRDGLGEASVEGPQADPVPVRDEKLAPARDGGLSDLLRTEGPEHHAGGGTERRRPIAPPHELVDRFRAQSADEVREPRAARPPRIEGAADRHLVGERCDLEPSRPVARPEGRECLPEAGKAGGGTVGGREADR